jgi:hypothetical protein
MVLSGNALWGIPVIFLFIPILVIVNLICDHMETIKLRGFLLGDIMPPLLKIRLVLKKVKNISK